jgi:F-type H+-transporting ATPase subunit delta
LQAGKRNDVSDSYAKALVELAEEKNTLESVHADVDTLAGLVSTNQKLAELLFNPVVEGDKKKAVVAKISKEAGFQKYTTNFLNLLVEKDRMNLLNEICESFEEQYCTLTDTQVRRAGNAGPGQSSTGTAVCSAAAGSSRTAVLGRAL